MQSHPASKLRRFIGCIAPELLSCHSFRDRPPKEKSAEEYELTLAKGQKMQHYLPGRPMGINHDASQPIAGRVTRSWADTNGVLSSSAADLEFVSRPVGKWMIEFVVDTQTKTKEGKFVVDEIDSGKLRALSLTHDVDTLEPIEVSLCETPARRGAGIIRELPAHLRGNATTGSGIRTYMVRVNENANISSVTSNEPVYIANSDTVVVTDSNKQAMSSSAPPSTSAAGPVGMDGTGASSAAPIHLHIHPSNSGGAAPAPSTLVSAATGGGPPSTPAAGGAPAGTAAPPAPSTVAPLGTGAPAPPQTIGPYGQQYFTPMTSQQHNPPLFQYPPAPWMQWQAYIAQQQAQGLHDKATFDAQMAAQGFGPNVYSFGGNQSPFGPMQMPMTAPPPGLSAPPATKPPGQQPMDTSSDTPSTGTSGRPGGPPSTPEQKQETAQLAQNAQQEPSAIERLLNKNIVSRDDANRILDEAAKDKAKIVELQQKLQAFEGDKKKDREVWAESFLALLGPQGQDPSYRAQFDKDLAAGRFDGAALDPRHSGRFRKAAAAAQASQEVVQAFSGQTIQDASVQQKLAIFKAYQAQEHALTNGHHAHLSPPIHTSQNMPKAATGYGHATAPPSMPNWQFAASPPGWPQMAPPPQAGTQPPLQPWWTPAPAYPGQQTMWTPPPQWLQASGTGQAYPPPPPMYQQPPMAPATGLTSVPMASFEQPKTLDMAAGAGQQHVPRKLITGSATNPNEMYAQALNAELDAFQRSEKDMPSTISWGRDYGKSSEDGGFFIRTGSVAPVGAKRTADMM